MAQILSKVMFGSMVAARWPSADWLHRAYVCYLYCSVKGCQGHRSEFTMATFYCYWWGLAVFNLATHILLDSSQVHVIGSCQILLRRNVMLSVLLHGGPPKYGCNHRFLLNKRLCPNYNLLVVGVKNLSLPQL